MVIGQPGVSKPQSGEGACGMGPKPRGDRLALEGVPIRCAHRVAHQLLSDRAEIRCRGRRRAPRLEQQRAKRRGPARAAIRGLATRRAHRLTTTDGAPGRGRRGAGDELLQLRQADLKTLELGLLFGRPIQGEGRAQAAP